MALQRELSRAAIPLGFSLPPRPAHHEISIRLLAFRASQLENVAAEDEQPAAQCGEVGIGWEVVSRRSFNA